MSSKAEAPKPLDARQQALVEQHRYVVLDLVNQVLGRYSAGLVSRNDLVSVGTTELANAARLYNPELGTQFITYVYTAVTGALIDALNHELRHSTLNDVARDAAKSLAPTTEIEGSTPFDSDELFLKQLGDASALFTAKMFVDMVRAEAEEDVEERVIASLDRPRNQAIIQRAIAESPAAYGELYRAHHVEGEDLGSIAARLGISVRTLGRYNRSFLEALRRHAAASQEHRDSQSG